LIGCFVVPDDDLLTQNRQANKTGWPSVPVVTLSSAVQERKSRLSQQLK
jgi:hypothetical protein